MAEFSVKELEEIREKEKKKEKEAKFFYGEEEYSIPDVKESLYFKETSSGKNIKLRYEPEYHQRMKEAYQTGAWVGGNLWSYIFINLTYLPVLGLWGMVYHWGIESMTDPQRDKP